MHFERAGSKCAPKKLFSGDTVGDTNFPKHRGSRTVDGLPTFLTEPPRSFPESQSMGKKPRRKKGAEGSLGEAELHWRPVGL